MWAFYVAAIFQFGWIGLAVIGVIRFDPYPFAFLLFLSSLAQLILMFVIMVGQDVLGRAGDQRAEQTFRDTEAVLHECRRLQKHLTAQDRLIGSVCDYVEQNAPKDHPIHAEMGLPAGAGFGHLLTKPLWADPLGKPWPLPPTISDLPRDAARRFGDRTTAASPRWLDKAE